MEPNWLQEMMTLSGIKTDEENESNEPYIPGMLPDWDDETFERIHNLNLAIDQTYRMIEEQEDMQDELRENAEEAAENSGEDE